MTICHKVKYHDKIAVMFALSKCKFSQRKGNHKREEKRFYWCEQCKAYHLTSKK